jgi:hypothetical protein
MLDVMANDLLGASKVGDVLNNLLEGLKVLLATTIGWMLSRKSLIKKLSLAIQNSNLTQYWATLCVNNDKIQVVVLLHASGLRVVISLYQIVSTSLAFHRMIRCQLS